MDSIEVTKVSTAVLVAGIAYFLTGTIGANLVHPERLEKPAIEIKGAAPETATGPAPEAPLAPIAPLLAAADPAVGGATFKKLCTSCHTINDGGKAGIGPNLYGVVGGPHAHMEGFNYTAGMKAKTGPWTFDELNEWLHKPSSYVPGTRMTFAGISNDKERADVIDFLHTQAKDPVPLPPVTQAAPPPAVTQAAPLPPVTQAAPPPAVTQAAPPPTGTQAAPPPPAKNAPPAPPATSPVPLPPAK